MVNSLYEIGFSRNPLGARFKWLHSKVASVWRNVRVIKDLAQAHKGREVLCGLMNDYLSKSKLT